jgi:8-oxo-dGTP diphosphatase
VEFTGAKIALLLDDRVLIYQRDDVPGLRHAGLWDLPGGGREGDETPLECVLRETEEEFGLRLDPDAVVWHRTYPSADFSGMVAHFFVGRITEAQVAAIRFGDEGQQWALVALSEVLERTDVVVHYQHRLRDYLAALAPPGDG